MKSDFSKAGIDYRFNEFIASADSLKIKLPDETLVLEELKKVIIFSDFVARNFLRNPDLLNDLLSSGDLYKEFAKDTYLLRLKKDIQNTDNEEELGKILRKRRMREMTRIAWRDLAGSADLFKTMSELTSFADACIEQTFAFLYKLQCSKYGIPSSFEGSPQDIVVLGMGKLGGRELNFSSDIDLIFAYPEAGETLQSLNSISNEEFFTKLSRSFIKVFGDITQDGIVFRVDMRLRPFGENGPLIMSFNALEEYYQRHGREWERYALIKARVVASDFVAGQRLLEILSPFIYRRYLDYGVYDSLRGMKYKISREVERKGLQDNVKLGAGGIREIEFFGQIFQLIRGGVEPYLRERSILKILPFLFSEGYIPKKVYDELTAAYVFLRNTEHRIQEFEDRQAHSLPSDDDGRMRLAFSMGYEDWESCSVTLKQHLYNVHSHFNELLVLEDGGQQSSSADMELDDVWQGIDDKNLALQIIKTSGFNDPQEIFRLLDCFRNEPATCALTLDGRKRLDRLMPLFLKKTGLSKQPEIIFKRVLDLIKTIERRTCYIALLLEKPDVLTHLIELSDKSPWIISFLTRHPVLLDELIDVRTLYTPLEKKELKKLIARRFERIPDDDLETQMEELAVFKQVNTLRVAAADISGAFPLMKVSDYLSYIAETVLQKVLNLSWNYLINKHGIPETLLNGLTCNTGFAIIAYGKLGGLELSYGSDLDLVFLHAGTESETRGVDIRPVTSAQFYARLGQRMLHLLTTHTPAGKLYEIDMRLRPNGSSGVLVTNMDSFRNYQKQDAWTWEHQSLVRARAICGDDMVISSFEQIRRDVLAIPRNKSTLQEDIISMRSRMRKEQKKTDFEYFNIKQGIGGMVDIEFLVQYLTLLNAHEHIELVKWSDNIRQLDSLAETKIIAKKEADFLKETYITYRAAVHTLNLQEKSAIVPEHKFKELSAKVTKIWNKLFCLCS
ncbi:MAG: bifunctional [glutamate--ammonia ligase]-adenylyl-L-tyrosine phosphorylase/[glutamate--ammonia-ligase] adenylyltransferase [Deltaproteobacteria bacterium]|nr:bifunctional [glutamate--ammonia ligase]-adenylyl-L-tyrosine phosphorylase/[glutamate--ammonia-ligase] adenylyltransferase [Deltaproteobacteria bacterium]